MSAIYGSSSAAMLDRDSIRLGGNEKARLHRPASSLTLCVSRLKRASETSESLLISYDANAILITACVEFPRHVLVRPIATLKSP